MDKKLMKRATAITLIFLAFVGIAYAAYWIYSNVVHVTYEPSQYTLGLTAEQTDDSITLTANLTAMYFGATSPVPVTDAEIHFYQTYQNETIIEELGFAFTGDDGVATYVWMVPSPTSNATIDYYFKAGYEVTQ